MATTQRIQQVLADSGVPTAQIGPLTAKVQVIAPKNNGMSRMKQFGDLISKSEGTAQYENPYAVGFGGVEVTDFSKHPNVGAKFKQTDGKTNISTASGKFQFLGSTYKDMAKKTGRSDFSPEAQDINFAQLMKDKGVDKLIEAGDYAGAINKLGGTFASLPSSKYPQPKHSWEKISKMNQEVGGPEMATPTYAGTTQKFKKPALSDQEILTAALPTAEENMAEAVKRDNAVAQEQQQVFAQQEAAQQNEMEVLAQARSKEIDGMLSTAFGYDDVFNAKPSKKTSYDAQLSKLIDLA
jgi:muramidase (phage lysozyme)